jgi:hypothetical protein
MNGSLVSSYLESDWCEWGPPWIQNEVPMDLDPALWGRFVELEVGSGSWVWEL